MKTKLKIPKLLNFKRKKLRARTPRRPVRIAATANYDEMAEPNMKLSRALLIVLLLHVVAVAGIIAFNAIKTRQGSFSSVAVPSGTTNSSAAALKAAPANSALQKPNQKSVKDSVKTDRASGPTESGKTYTVAKGDNPVTIAKKFKVPYDDLVELNHIDDPRKLKIGQKLLIPAKPNKAKKSD